MKESKAGSSFELPIAVGGIQLSPVCGHEIISTEGIPVNFCPFCGRYQIQGAYFLDGKQFTPLNAPTILFQDETNEVVGVILHNACILGRDL
jgi:hypothetical protein